MNFTTSALFALLLCWSLQVAGSWVQWRHYQQSVLGSQKTWGDGFLGIGKARKRFGFGAIALVVVSKDLVVRRLQIMKGFSVFARFKDVPLYEGMRIETLQESLRAQQVDEKVATAIRDAIQRIEEVHGKQ